MSKGNNWEGKQREICELLNKLLNNHANKQHGNNVHVVIVVHRCRLVCLMYTPIFKIWRYGDIVPWSIKRFVLIWFEMTFKLLDE